MHSEGYSTWVSLSVCLSVSTKLTSVSTKLTSRMSNRAINKGAYSVACEFAWLTGKTRVCFAARVSGFTAIKRTSKPFRKITETCCDPTEDKSIHICLFVLCKAVPC